MKALMKNKKDLMPGFPSIFDDFFGGDWMNWAGFNNSLTGTTLPAVNVSESNDAFNIEVAAPGMKKNDFKIDLDNNLLIISSEKEDKNEEVDKEGNFHRKEFSYQSFKRSFSLPLNAVDHEKINAKYNEGILHIEIPKKEEAKLKPVKQIKVW